MVSWIFSCKFYGTFQSSSSKKAVIRRCSVKKLFLKNSQNLQKSTCAKASILLIERLWQRCFLWILWNFSEQLFYGTPLEAASVRRRPLISYHLKELTKSYFRHYSCAVIILFNTGLRRSALFTISYRTLL